MLEGPEKLFPCDCKSEGIIVNKEISDENISEGEILVEEDLHQRKFTGSPYIEFTFWSYGHPDGVYWSWWERLHIAWHIFRTGRPWGDMVTMEAKVAKNLAYHILYIIGKGEKEKKFLQKPLVKDEG